MGTSSSVSVEELDLADRVWKAAKEHVGACERHLYESENTEADPGPGPATMLYDGCTECVIRETLHAAWEVMRPSASPSPSAGAPSAPAAAA